MTQTHIPDENKTRTSRAKQNASEPPGVATTTRLPPVSRLQQTIGNRAVQRLLAQRAGDGAFELDEATQARINRERGGGQPLDNTVRASMGKAMGQALPAVRVHTSPTADALSRDLGARTFTTGRDIFFSAGAYEPHSTSGQELLAHELTHVAQQNAGAGSSGGEMTVNAPGDVYEQEADAVAKTIVNHPATNGSEIQRQMQDQEEEEEQLKPEEEEEEAVF